VDEVAGGVGGGLSFKRVSVSVAYPGDDAPVVLETIFYDLPERVL